MKKYMDVRLNTIERNLQGNNTIEYLEYISRELSDLILIERLKVAGYFVTDRNKISFNQEKQREIEKWIRTNCSKEAKRKFYKYSRDGKMLSSKKKAIEKQIKRYISYIKNQNIDTLQLLKYVNDIIWDNVTHNYESKTFQEQIIVSNENIILGIGTLLRYGLLKEHNEGKSIISPKKYMQIMESMQAYNAVNDIIRNWIFGDVTLKRKHLSVLYIYENYGIVSDRIISIREYISLNAAKETKTVLAYPDNSNEINIYENSLREKVAEFFYTKDFQEEYIGITLEEWIKIYTFFYDFAHHKNEIIRIDKQQLIKLLEKKFDKNTISVVLEAFTFDEKSNDLFSSFLIEQGEDYLILPSIIKVTEPLKSMMSLFTKHKYGEISKKGNSFEKYIRNILYGVNAKSYIESNLLTHHNGESYELDILLYLNNTLFVFECKTQFQHEDVRGYYRNVLEIEYYLSKFKRNLEYFTKEKSGQDSLNNRFKKKISDFNVRNVKVVPIFVSNISYPFVKQDNVYVLDAIRLYNYFEKKPPLIHYTDNISKAYYCIGQMSPKLFDGNISDSNFIYYLENCKEYTIDIKKPIREVEIFIRKYGIRARRLIYDEDCLEEVVKEYIKTHSIF
ncbi:MAG: hypothetical protein UEU90_05095 [Lachnospiraceae bacterium]|nr:hypothetical protein [Lachnospiraceae bacterium]